MGETEWSQQKGKGLTGSGLRGETAERSLLLPEVLELEAEDLAPSLTSFPTQY